MKALGQLSGYIKHSLDTGNSIWIAQKKGAKDGNDFTDPAILKCSMLKVASKGRVWRVHALVKNCAGLDCLRERSM